MNVKLKICGMRDSENILQVAELQPDYMGFIFYEKSKRFVGKDFTLPASLDPRIKRVGVFVNESTEKMLSLARLHKLDIIQLHGEESVSQCLELKSERLGVIKAFLVDEHFTFAEVEPFKNVVDYFLFDTKSDQYGGTGKIFDWNLLNKYDQQLPFFLSGGLSAKVIEAAKKIDRWNLHAYDLNSGIEISPGVKSINKIEEVNKLLTT